MTFEWQSKNQRLVVEYRRTPAQIYSARIVDTIGISDEDHEEVSNILAREEWRIRPRYQQITRLGIWKSLILSVLFVSVVLWGGSEVFIGSGSPYPAIDNVLLYSRSAGAQGVVAALFCLAFVAFRCACFPSGVFRIGEETEEQKRRDRIQKQIIQWIRGAVVLGFLLLFGWGVHEVTLVCQDAYAMKGNKPPEFFSEFLSRTNVCRFLGK